MAHRELDHDAWLAGSEGLFVMYGDVHDDYQTQFVTAEGSSDGMVTYAKGWQGSQTFVCKPLVKYGSYGSEYQAAVLQVRCRALLMPASLRLVLKRRLSACQELHTQAVLAKHRGLLALHAVYESWDCIYTLTPLCEQSLTEHLVSLPKLSEQACGSLELQLMSVLGHCHQKGKYLLCSDDVPEAKQAQNVWIDGT